MNSEKITDTKTTNKITIYDGYEYTFDYNSAKAAVHRCRMRKREGCPAVLQIMKNGGDHILKNEHNHKITQGISNFTIHDGDECNIDYDSAKAEVHRCKRRKHGGVPTVLQVTKNGADQIVKNQYNHEITQGRKNFTIHDGYEYSFDYNTAKAAIHRCRMRRRGGCPAVLQIMKNDGDHILKNQHNHEIPDPAKLEARKLVNKMKDNMKLPGMTPKVVIDKNTIGVGKKILQNLPKKTTLIRFLRKHRGDPAIPKTAKNHSKIKPKSDSCNKRYRIVKLPSKPSNMVFNNSLSVSKEILYEISKLN